MPMAVSEPTPVPTDLSIAAETKSEERRALAVGCGAHALHDGFTDLIYVVLPLWQEEFALPYAAVGMLRTTFSGTMAALQIPSTLLARRLGAAVVLAAGTALSGLCFCLAGMSVGFPMLLAALLLGGIGASTQHPIASSLVARAFEGPRAITALGTYNFAGDIGKMAIPAAATVLLWLALPWRSTVGILGFLGFAAAAAILLLMPRFAPEPKGAAANTKKATAVVADPASRRAGFRLLLSIGAIDSLSRAAFMVFVPFLIIAKGGTVATGGLALTLVFIGGAAGKLACAWIGKRFGIIGAVIITELLTAVGILSVLYLPLAATLPVLPIVGIVLNGSSSLTYGTVPRFVAPGQRDRAFGIFYTGTLGCGALSPTLSGFIGDAIGMNGAVMIAAALAVATLPLTLLLAPHMRDRAL
jgi:MFS family permease